MERIRTDRIVRVPSEPITVEDGHLRVGGQRLTRDELISWMCGNAVTTTDHGLELEAAAARRRELRAEAVGKVALWTAVGSLVVLTIVAIALKALQASGHGADALVVTMFGALGVFLAGTGVLGLATHASDRANSQHHRATMASLDAGPLELRATALGTISSQIATQTLVLDRLEGRDDLEAVRAAAVRDALVEDSATALLLDEESTPAERDSAVAAVMELAVRREAAERATAAAVEREQGLAGYHAQLVRDLEAPERAAQRAELLATMEAARAAQRATGETRP